MTVIQCSTCFTIFEDQYNGRLIRFHKIKAWINNLTEKASKGKEIKSMEVIPLPNNEVRYIQKETTVVKDEKYRIIDNPSLSAARESIASEFIKSSLNLGPHKRLVLIEDDNEKK
jgi:microcompartment protein CcmL/EutN